MNAKNIRDKVIHRNARSPFQRFAVRFADDRAELRQHVCLVNPAISLFLGVVPRDLTATTSMKSRPHDLTEMLNSFFNLKVIKEIKKSTRNFKFSLYATIGVPRGVRS